MAYAQSMREQLPRLAAQMREIVDAAKAENNRGLSSEEREKFHKLENDYSNLEESIKVAEKSDSISEKLASVTNATQATDLLQNSIDQLRDEFRTNPRAKKQKTPKDQVFSKYMRNGLGALNGEERQLMQFLPNSAGQPTAIRNTMSTTTGSQGGYIIPQGFSDMLEEAKKWFGGIDGTVGKFQTETGNPFPWPTLNDTMNKGRIIGQNVQVTETDLAFGQVMFNAYIGSSDIVLVPLALIEDSYFNLDALIARLLGTRLGRLFNWKATTGSGTNEPTGLSTAAVNAGSIYTCPTGETTSLTYNDLVNLEHTVDPDYRYTPSTYFMFSDAVLKILKKLVDGNNRPLWQPGLTSSFQQGGDMQGMGASHPTILDHKYIVNQDLATPAANAYTALFGDLSAFKVREVSGGTTVLRLAERYADYLQVGFTAFQRWDSNLIDAGSHPIATLQQSST